MDYTTNDTSTTEATPLHQQESFSTEPVIAQPEAFKATTISSVNPFAASEEADTSPSTTTASESRADVSLQQSLMDESGLIDCQPGSTLRGEVLRVDKEGVLVDVNYKTEGFVPSSETGFSSQSEIEGFYTDGKVLDLKVLKLETADGYILLSKRAMDMEKGLEDITEAYDSQEVLEAKVENAVKGGLIVSIKGHRGFLPASHVAKTKKESLDTYVGETLKVLVIDYDKTRKKIIVSHKKAVDTVRNSESTANLLDSLEAGNVVKGRVSSIKSFGVFVDLGGIEGLIHVSELSWKRVRNPEDIVKVGQEIDVFILGVDKAGRKVSLGYKQLFPDPWVTVEETYKVGDEVSGTVSRICSFGAFIMLDNDLEGLVHISEISDKNITNIEDELSIGEPVKVKVLRVIPEEKKIGLSIKAVQDMEAGDIIPTEQKETAAVTIGDAVNMPESLLTEEDDKLADEVLNKSGQKGDDLALNMDEVLNM